MRIYRLFLVSFILFIFCIASVSSTLSQESLPAIVKKVEPSVVVIITYDREGEILIQGSGFFISKNGNVVTNCHVLQGATRAEVKTTDGSVYPVKNILAEDQEGDLILVSVEISTNAVHPLPVSHSLPERGERVIVIGSPLGLEQTVADGIVSAVREIPAFTIAGTYENIIQITAPISQGSSGSPVVNMKGEVIGIATFLIVEGQNLNFAVPAERLARLSPVKTQTLAEKRAEEIEESKYIYVAGIKYLWAKDYEKALSRFEEAVEKNPHNAEAYHWIGYCNDLLRRFHEAVEAYKQAIRINPDLGVAYFGLGMAYLQLGRHQDGIEACKQAIRLHPDFVGAYYFLGRNYAALKHVKDAMEAYKEAIRINPDFAYAHCELGLLYAVQGRIRDAIEALKLAIRINPNLHRAHYAHHSLGLCYLLLGDKGSALEEYKILKDLDKDLANGLFNAIYE